MNNNVNHEVPPPGGHNPSNYKVGAKSGRRKVKRVKGAHVDSVRHQKLKFDPKLANGPAANRSCTDIPCCLIFTAFLAGWFYISVYAFANGKPHLLVTPFDTDEKGCGYDEGYVDTRFIYFWRLTDPTAFSDGSYYKETICVSECPSYDKSVDSDQWKTFQELGISCKDTKSSGDCKSKKAMDTSIYLGRFCFLKFQWVREFGSAIKGQFAAMVKKFEQSETAKNWAADTATTWWIILLSVVICLVISFFYMHVLRCFADIVTWIFILALVAVVGLLGYFLLNWASNKQDEVNAAEAATGESTSSTEQAKITFAKYSGWGLVGFSGLSLLIVFCICHKIRLITAIIETAAHFINNTMTVLLVPIFNTFLAIIFSAIWLVSTVFLYSVGDIEKRGEWPITNVKWTDWTRRFWYFNLFAILWIVAFVICMGDFIIACACCIWYFNQGGKSKKKEEQKVSKSISPVKTAYWWVVRYHFGSIAVGSFMIALIWAIRLIMAYVHQKLKESGATKNKFIDYLMKCIHCCLACFERFIRFVNKQAFIYIGITGQNFFNSTIDAFKVVLRHPIEFALLSGLGHLFMYMGIAVIIFGTVAISYLLMKIDSIEKQISSPFFPLVLIGVIAYFVADLFVEVYLVASYAILHCYYVDKKLCEGSQSAPRNAPKELRKFLKKKKVEYEEVSVSDSFDSQESRDDFESISSD